MTGTADFSRLFNKGPCPTIKGMETIDYKRLSGDWFLQWTQEPAAPELLPACHHANWKVSEDGKFTAQEELRIQGKTFQHERVSGHFDKSKMSIDLSEKLLTAQMELLDTDYDNYMIVYQCFDNLQFQFDKELEPAHMITVGISTRTADHSDADLQKYEDLLLSKVPEFHKDDLAKVLSGKAGHCEYKLKL